MRRGGGGGNYDMNDSLFVCLKIIGAAVQENNYEGI